MATEATLIAALELLTSPSPTTVETETFRAQGLSRTERRRLTTQVQQSRGWNRDDNLVGYGIAEKETRDGSTDVLSLAVYVKKKLPLSVLADGETVPRQLNLEGLPEAVPTDVVEMGELRLQALTSKVRPINGGFSIGHANTTGTFGCLVTERTNGRRLILSNSHVLADSGNARVGDPIFQPGPGEEDSTMEAVARLIAWQPFTYGETGSNRIDAALAEPLNQDWFACEIFNIGIPKGIIAPARGMMVQKSGRTTGHTFGRVKDVNFTTTLFYPLPGGGEAPVRFRDQVVCSCYSARGDSGALILDGDCRAVGLHFCGSDTLSVFHPITFVLEELGVDLISTDNAELHLAHCRRSA